MRCARTWLRWVSSAIVGAWIPQNLSRRTGRPLPQRETVRRKSLARQLS